MAMEHITFHIVPFGSADWKKALALKEAVLRAPLGQTFTADELKAEDGQTNVVAKAGHSLVATALLVEHGDRYKMQRVAVEPSWRNKGVGKALLSFCESHAADLGAAAMYCHARDTAINFYRQNNYKPEGDVFEEDGIPHLMMNKVLRQ